MKVPRTLRIAGRRWKVVRGPCAETEDPRVGECDHATRTITIAEHLTGADLEQTMCHELLHACLPEANFIVTLKQEELLVELLCQRLPGVIKQVWRLK